MVSYRSTDGLNFESRLAVPEPKRFVYILKSINTVDTYYVGVTSCVVARLPAHNAGLSPHTAEHRPWRTLVLIEFDEEALRSRSSGT